MKSQLPHLAMGLKIFLKRLIQFLYFFISLENPVKPYDVSLTPSSQLLTFLYIRTSTSLRSFQTALNEFVYYPLNLVHYCSTKEIFSFEPVQIPLINEANNFFLSKKIAAALRLSSTEAPQSPCTRMKKARYLEVEKIHYKALKTVYNSNECYEELLIRNNESPFIKNKYVHWLLRFTKA